MQLQFFFKGANLNNLIFYHLNCLQRISPLILASRIHIEIPLGTTMKYGFFSTLSLLLSLHVYCQDFDATFRTFSEQYVSERVHIHFDKSTYGAGDTIWFKGYLLNALSPVNRSKNFYIDWTDAQGKLIERTVSPIVGGITMGQIAIPPAYKDGFIHAKAYTKWMLNFDSAFLFNKDIRVLSEKTVANKPVPVVPSIVFFPEGGNLLNNVVNKVAFKIADQYGRPVEGSGSLTVNGQPTEKFKSIHDGMGFFFVRPEVGKKYSVTWLDEKGTQHHTDLPDAIDEGIALQIGWMQGRRSFMIQGTGKYATQSVRIVGTMFDQLVFNIVRPLENGATQGIIPVNSLPSGILRITVLDAQYHPLAERISFINNHEYQFDAGMEVTHWGLNKRARNEIEISIPDSLSANLSVSVTDGQLDFDTTSGIISDLLLTSELKGKVNDAEFYFKDVTDSTEKLLDLVMMTNGWRKISWTDLASGKLPEIKYPRDSTYLSLSGKVLGATPVQLQQAGDLILIVNQKKNSEWLMAPILPDGSFAVKDFLLFDTALVYYQAPKGKGLRDVSVQFKSNPLPIVTGRVPAGLGKPANADTSGYYRQLQLTKELQAELEMFKGKVLDEIKIEAKTKRPEELMDEKYTSGMFSGGNSRSFDIISDPAAVASMNIFSYLQGRIPGLTIDNGNPPTLTYRSSGAPAIFLDEMPASTDMLSNIPVADIAYVKFISPPFMGAAGGGGNGAIAVYTRKGNDIQYEPGKGLSRNSVTGYSVIRQFYSPDYEKMESDKKDLRTTLYWNPEVMLGPGKNKIVLKFFNNDVSESFRVVIEGMTPDGKMARIVKMME